MSELAWLCRVSEEEIKSDLECLLEAGFIDLDGDVWYIPSLRGGGICSQVEGKANQHEPRRRQRISADGELQDVAPSVNGEHRENDDRWDEQSGEKSPSDYEVLLQMDSKSIRNGYTPVTNRYQNMIEQSYLNVTNRNQNFNEQGYDPVTKRIKNSRQYRYSSITDIDIESDKESEKELQKEGEESHHHQINDFVLKNFSDDDDDDLTPINQNPKFFNLIKIFNRHNNFTGYQCKFPNCEVQSLPTLRGHGGRSPPASLRDHPGLL